MRATLVKLHLQNSFIFFFLLYERKVNPSRVILVWLKSLNIEYISKKLVADMNLNEGGYIFIVCIYAEQENIKCTLHNNLWIGRKYILIHNLKWSSNVLFIILRCWLIIQVMFKIPLRCNFTCDKLFILGNALFTKEAFETH